MSNENTSTHGKKEKKNNLKTKITSFQNLFKVLYISLEQDNTNGGARESSRSEGSNIGLKPPKWER